MAVHGILAATLAPEFEIDKPEADLLAGALTELNRFYGKTIDPKLIAWMGVIGVCGKVYGPRVAAYGIRRKMEKPEAPPKPTPQSFRPTVVTPPPQPRPAANGVDFSSLTSVPHDFGDN